MPEHVTGFEPQGESSGFSLRGRTVVITGASKNIGAAMARGFAQAGADLLLIARGSESLNAVADELRARTNRRIETLVCDVGQPDAGNEIADFASRMLSGVDVLVNNAFTAGSSLAPILATEDTVWEEVLRTNLLGPMRLSRALAPQLEKSENGSIINLVSGSGFLPTANMGVYGVSKAALWMMTRYLAVEAAPNIRVNALCPGIVPPEGQADHEVYRGLLPLVPMGRLGRPDEMVGAAIYLASDSASYTTGEVIFVNGGRPW
ncbi:SDR family oxidoreductase [Mycolicibacterium sp. CH28]|uniref:SDR family NAD(P)-dependent oxidoreductase n=1 Tax=Mycolicibacterium sp. CH28 TaxID=2512237 RepID=UPI0010810B08|nr:SDR family oxidoreductase [Mycolicibacterium sp. CH28]TGD85912.1 SDR family oxidoreductase [Mycolicibacterium sp. CH28]